MPKKPDPPADGWRCPRCREKFVTPELAADHLVAAVDKAQADVKRLSTVLLDLERTTACYCEPGTGIPRVPPHTTACREAVVAMRDITGFGTWALYSAGVYKEPYPNQARTVIAPVGDPLFLMYHPYEENVPLCHCGGASSRPKAKETTACAPTAALHTRSRQSDGPTANRGPGSLAL